MKSYLTGKRISIFVAAFLSILATNTISAKIYDVNVSNTKFTPKDITINTGDTVNWTNTQGTHNVDGEKSLYPNNPESFGNSVGGSGWVYTHVFTIPGKYDYRCDPHANFGMVGTVTVENASNVEDKQIAELLNMIIYPNPSKEFILIKFSDTELSDFNFSLIMSNIEGKEVFKYENIKLNLLKIDTEGFVPGVYLIAINEKGKTLKIEKFIIE